MGAPIGSILRDGRTIDPAGDLLGGDPWAPSPDGSGRYIEIIGIDHLATRIRNIHGAIVRTPGNAVDDDEVFVGYGPFPGRIQTIELADRRETLIIHGARPESSGTVALAIVKT